MTLPTETATNAKLHFGALLDKAQKTPVLIEKSGRKVAVVMSYEEYEAIQALDDAYWLARAEEAQKEGFLSPKESKKFLDQFRDA